MPYLLLLTRRGSSPVRQRPYPRLAAIAGRVLPADLQLILRAFLRLSPRIAWFYVCAYALARRHRDRFALSKSTQPEDLSSLLRLAAGRCRVVELGSGAGWTAIAMALADPHRRVISYDPVSHPLRERYARLAGAEVKSRVDLRRERAEGGPAPDDPPVDFLFIDIGGHTRTDAVAAFLAWRGSLGPGALVVFHDYGPHHPGVAEAVAELGLRGGTTGQTLFVWRVPELSGTLEP